MRLRSLVLAIVAIASLIVIGGALSGRTQSFAAELPWLVPSFAAELPWPDPDWLQGHVGEGEGQIAPVVLQRARALYLNKMSEGAVNNPCYFAMDATRPGGLGRRFYVICEADRTFRAVPSGHGDGRNLEGIADFANDIRCAKNFSNAMDFPTDDRRAVCDGRNQNVVQRLLSHLGRKKRGPDALVRPVRRRGRHGERQTARHRRAIRAVVVKGTAVY